MTVIMVSNSGEVEVYGNVAKFRIVNGRHSGTVHSRIEFCLADSIYTIDKQESLYSKVFVDGIDVLKLRNDEITGSDGS